MSEKSLLTVNRLEAKPIVQELKRIGDALELLLLHAYGVRLTPTPKPREDESDVLYSTDMETFKQELVDVAAHRNPERVVDVDEV